MKQIFSDLTELPHDPIYGLQETFIHDPRPEKLNLSIGVLTSENGKLTRFQAVDTALTKIWPISFGYLPITGNSSTATLLLNEFFPNQDLNHFTSCQSIGGTGALFLLLKLMQKTAAITHVAYLTPSWPNHKNIIQETGLIETPLNDLDQETLEILPKNTLLLLQPSCNNPTGIPIPLEKKKKILETAQEKNIPLLFDLPYWGLGTSLEKDLEFIHLAYTMGLDFLIAFSASKSFGLYNLRTGWAFTHSKKVPPDSLKSHFAKLARSVYSSPPGIGSAIIHSIFSDSALKTLWVDEINKKRVETLEKRMTLSRALQSLGYKNEIHLGEGLFTMLPLSQSSITELREEHALYIGLDGRINIASIKQIEPVAERLQKKLLQ